MNKNDSMYEFMKQVSDTYRKVGSLQKTADELGIAYAKVRKILITLGEYETEFSLEVAKKRRIGKSISEIAVEMNTSANRVNAFLPYEKVVYEGSEQSNDSRKSKHYRKRIKVAKEHFVTNNIINEYKNKNDEMKSTILEKEPMMESNARIEKTNLSAVYLHLELNDHISDYQKRMLHRYGEVPDGESISRDILIPSDMMLHNLHYAIQRLFGWQNSHLRKFYLPEEVYQKLTNSTVKGWSDLVGILFQPPGEAESDVFWDDNYQSGSIKVWLKKKYTSPYFYGGAMEHFNTARRDVKDLLDNFTMIDVKESFHEYWKRKQVEENTEIKILRRAPLIDLTLEEMNSSFLIEGGTESLLERLEVCKVLADSEETLAVNDVFPVTRELIYNYDFGDNWIVTITKINNCEELLASGAASEEELIEANATVMSKHKPVCIHKEGIFVLDDVGGLCGFADFLGRIYESEDKEESAELRNWAHSLGWSSKKISNKMML